MTYIGVIASAVLHVGGLFLLLSARAPEPLIPPGTDVPLDVNIISLNEYNALISTAPSSGTLAALRAQPAAPQPPTISDVNPPSDVADQPPATPLPRRRPVELALRPPPVEDVLPDVSEPEQPDSAEVTVQTAPAPLVLDEAALQDRGVDPSELLPSDEMEIAIAPPVQPEPPRGVFDAPVFDTSPDEPPEPAETEGEAELQPEPAQEPESRAEETETAELAPLMTPLPRPKPRGSLAVASDPEREETQVAVRPEPVAPPVPARPVPEPESEPEEPQQQLTDAELEEERRMMQALIEQMRGPQPPTLEEQRAAEAQAAREFAEEQRRAELAEEERAALSEAERLEAEEKAAREREKAEREARELAALRAREAAVLQARREEEEAQRRAEIEAQRRAEAARQQAERDRQQRIRQLEQLNAQVSPESRADQFIAGAAPAAQPAQPDSLLGGRLASILSAADNAAQSARTGPSFGQAGVSRGANLTEGETQQVLSQLRACWRVDTFSSNAQNRIVTVRAQIRQNGFVNQGTIQVVDPVPAPPEFRIAIERAVTALQDRQCQPFALPPSKYAAWNEIVIRFDPAQMVLQ